MLKTLTPMWMNKRLITLILLTLSVQLFADDSPSVYFAKQAGVIAGAAEACGQPISIMVMRTGEAINALATDPMDKTYAAAAFEKMRQDAHTRLIQSQQITCPQVITDFNSLPLLQPDYRTTVIQPLAASNPAATATPAAQATAANTPPPTTAPTVATPATNNPLLPPTTTPAQSYVAGNNTPTPPAANSSNPANMPPINPSYNPNSGGTPPPSNSEIARLQLAQQLAQMAQTLVATNQPSVVIGAGQPSQYNPAYNPQLNPQLYGTGANNPIFTGQPFPPIGSQQPVNK